MDMAMLQVALLLLQCLALSGVAVGEASIVEQPETTSVIGGEAAVFLCRSAKSDPPSLIEWLVNGTRRSSYPRYYEYSLTAGGSNANALIIDPASASRDNNTRITCAVRSSARQRIATESHAMLYVYGSASDAPNGFPRIAEGSSLLVIESGKTMELACRATGEQPISVQWMLSNMPVHLTYFGSDYRIREDGTLIVEQASSLQEGRYRCSARNSLGLAVSSEITIFVRVRSIPPYFSRRPENIEVLPGDSASLTCEAVGHPVPTVHWLNSFGLEMCESRDGKNVLQLTNITSGDNFTCVAENSLGRITWTVSMRVHKIPEPPTPVIERPTVPTSTAAPPPPFLRFSKLLPTLTSVPLGGTINLTCEARGYPEPLVSWYNSQGHKIASSQMGKSVLTMADIVNDNNFTCMAENTFGRISRVVEVRVHSVPKLPNPPSEIQIMEIEPTAVVIAFKKSTTPGVLFYIVSYREREPREMASMNWTEVEIAPNAPSGGSFSRLRARISGLKPRTDYLVKVDSVTAKASSKGSPRTIVEWFRTPEMAAPGSPPKNIVVNSTFQNAIIISWDEPDKPNGAITEYEILYAINGNRGVGPTNKVSVPYSGKEYILLNLEPSTTYQVRVRARNQIGYGPLSSVFSVSTGKKE